MIHPFTIKLWNELKGKEGVEVRSRYGEQRFILTTSGRNSSFPVIAETPKGHPFVFTPTGRFSLTNSDDDDDLLIHAPDPEPVWRAWTFKTRPKGQTVFVWRNGFITDRLIVAWSDDGVTIAATDSSNYKVSYDDLFENWNQMDGSKCGTKEGA